MPRQAIVITALVILVLDVLVTAFEWALFQRFALPLLLAGNLTAFVVYVVNRRLRGD